MEMGEGQGGLSALSYANDGEEGGREQGSRFSHPGCRAVGVGRVGGTSWFSQQGELAGWWGAGEVGGLLLVFYSRMVGIGEAVNGGTCLNKGSGGGDSREWR